MTQSKNPDAELIELGRELDRLAAIERGHLDAERWDHYETAFNTTRAVVGKIEALEAKTLAGLRVKARAVLWCHSGEDDFSLVLDQDTTDMRLATQIVAALARGELIAAE